MPTPILSPALDPQPPELNSGSKRQLVNCGVVSVIEPVAADQPAIAIRDSTINPPVIITKTKVCATLGSGQTELLTGIEKSILKISEATIAHGSQEFYGIGAAHRMVRDGRLYREGHATHDEYLKRRWGISRSEGNRLIDAANVKDNLSPIGDVYPSKLSHIRHLARLTPEQQRTVWSNVIKGAGPGIITAKLIEKVATQHFPKVDGAAVARLEAAQKLSPVSDFHYGTLDSARGNLEPKSAKLIIVNTALIDVTTAMGALRRFCSDACGVIAICDFKSEPEVRKELADTGSEVIDRSIYYGQIKGRSKTSGTVARHRSILLAALGGFEFNRDGVSRLPDPLEFEPDKDFLDALPIGLFRTLIEAFTVEGETVVVPSDRYAAGVIAARRTKRNVLGVEGDENHYLRGRDRIDKVCDAPKRLDAQIEADRIDPANAAEMVDPALIAETVAQTATTKSTSASSDITAAGGAQ
jgi:hypothetical protein